MKLERALAGATEPALLRSALAAIGTPQVNRAHVAVLAYQVALNPHGRDVAWEWLTTKLLAQATSLRGTGLDQRPARAHDAVRRARPRRGRGPGGVREAAGPGRGARIRKGLEWLRVFEALRARVAPNRPAA